MKDQTSSLTDIDNDTISYVVQYFLVNYIPFAQARNAKSHQTLLFFKMVGYARLACDCYVHYHSVGKLHSVQFTSFNHQKSRILSHYRPARLSLLNSASES